MVTKKTQQVWQASGKRKRAIARATLRLGNGAVRINSSLIDTYQPQMSKMLVQEPLLLAGDAAKQVTIDVRVAGGGFQGQAEAARLAIARVLTSYDKKLKQTFLAYDRHMLVADVRQKEMRKPNDSKARAKRQTSYR